MVTLQGGLGTIKDQVEFGRTSPDNLKLK